MKVKDIFTDENEWELWRVLRDGKVGDEFNHKVDGSYTNVRYVIALTHFGKKILKNTSNGDLLTLTGMNYEGAYVKKLRFVDTETAIKAFRIGKTITSYVNNQLVDSYNSKSICGNISAREILYAKWIIEK